MLSALNAAARKVKARSRNAKRMDGFMAFDINAVIKWALHSASYISEIQQTLFPVPRRFIELLFCESKSLCYASGHHDIPGLVHVHPITR